MTILQLLWTDRNTENVGLREGRMGGGEGALSKNIYSYYQEAF